MKKVFFSFIVIAMLFSVVLLTKYRPILEVFSKSTIDPEISAIAIQLVNDRNNGILSGDKDAIASLYDRSTKYGKWAYEHETIKMRYMTDWSKKQDAEFIGIDADVVIRSIKDYSGSKRVNFLSCTKYLFKYNGSDIVDDFTVGTNHSMVIKQQGDKWVISKEWYKDPMGDRIRLTEKQIEDSVSVIKENTKSEYKTTNRRLAVVEYAQTYCGTASEDNNYRYNKKYRNYNYVGGDCANFASQILYEAGKFRQTGSWKYYKNSGSKAWVNAQAFKNNLIYSGRGSVIASGKYSKILKASYKLMPGDIVAYEKKGKVTHVSIVTGADSRGYAYVHSHNSDRSKVPFDIGFSGNDVKFWLIRVHL